MNIDHYLKRIKFSTSPKIDLEPEKVKAMKDGLAKLKEQGINS